MKLNTLKYSHLILTMFMIPGLTINVVWAQSRDGRGHRPGNFGEGGFGTMVEKDRGGDHKIENNCRVKFDREIDKAKRDVDQREIDACEAGHEAGIRMAQKTGSSQGRSVGMLQGLSKGIDVGYDYSQDDLGEIQAGKNSVSANTFPSAESRAESEAIRLATQQAQDDVYSRFHRAVDQNSAADSRVLVPTVPYSGLTGGFSYDNQTYMTEEQLFRSEISRRSDLPDFNRGDDFYDSNERSEFSNLDYWRLRGYHGDSNEFNRRFSAWNDSDRALRYFIDSPMGGEYNRLRDGVRTEYHDQVVAPTTPPTAPTTTPTTPPAPGDKPGRGPKPGDRKPGADSPAKVAVQVTVSAETYRGIFSQAFKASYKGTVGRVFSEAYYQALDLGYGRGLLIGEAVGLKAAFQSGRIEEYNSRYQMASVEAFRNAYRNVYTNEFKQRFQDRQNSTNLEIEQLTVTGKVNDGILRAGEPIAATYTVANYGGRAKTVTVRFYGDIDGTSEQTQITVPGVSRLQFSTKFLARIALGKNPRDYVNVGIEVDGITRPAHLQIDNIVEVNSMQVQQLNAVGGHADIEVQVINPATVVNPQGHQLTLEVEGITTAPIVKMVEPLNPNESRKIVFSLDGIDPLVLINKGVRAQVTATMSGEVLDSQRIERNVENRKIDLSTYFDQLVLAGEGLAHPIVPAGVDPALRLQAVQNQIFTEVQSSVANKYYVDQNPWKNDPNSTLEGQLSIRFASHAPRSEKYSAQYQGIGNMLWALRNTFDDSIFKSSRSSYAEVVRSFAPKVDGKNKK